MNAPTEHTRPEPESEDVLPLCARCEALDLQNVLRWTGTYWFIDLGQVDRPDKISCPLCRLFREMLPDEDATEPLGVVLSVISSTDMFCDKIYGQAREKLMQTLSDTALLGVMPARSKPRRKSRHGPRQILKQLNSAEKTGFLALACPRPITRRFRPLVLDSKRVDLTFIQNSLRFCAKNHTKSCNIQMPASMTWIRLIDCGSRSILPAEEDQEYLALSYVWGKEQKPPQMSNPLNGQHTEPSSLLSGSLPRVIEDAISLTLSLGYRYLWVDRYCIPDGDAAEKHSQISKMDMIYAHATATIVAAAGEGADYGLPGVGQTPRKRQPQARMKEGVLVSTLPSARGALKSSKWMTRAWTYQEAILSRRLLIFTDHQLYFECRGMHCSEAVVKPLSILHTKDKQRLQSVGEPRLFPHNGIGEEPWDVATRIMEYSTRELTYDFDALKAMMGIFRSFATMDRPVDHYWGVPVLPAFDYSDKEVLRLLPLLVDGWTGYWPFAGAFAVGLCWTCTEPAARRPGFPSWSWTGWKGRLDPSTRERYWTRKLETWHSHPNPSQSPEEGDFKSLSVQKDTLQISIELADGNLVGLQEIKIAYLRGLDYSTVSPYLHLEGYAVSLDFQLFTHGPPHFPTGELADPDPAPRLWAAFDIFEDNDYLFDHSKKMFVRTEGPALHQGYAPLVLCKDADADADFHARLTTETWQGFVVSNSHTSYITGTREPSYCLFLLVYDTDGDTAERVGTVDLRDAWVRDTTFEGDPYPKRNPSSYVKQSKQKIRLG